jgi:hypothetical protein
MSMKRLSIALSLAAGLAAAFAACDDRGPIAPSRLPPASSEPAIYSLGGLVTEPVDVGVDGATVTVMDGSAKGVSSITEGGGSYSLSGVGGTFTVQVTKDGYHHPWRKYIDRIATGLRLLLLLRSPAPVGCHRDPWRQSVPGDLRGNHGDRQPILDCWNPERAVRTDAKRDGTLQRLRFLLERKSPCDVHEVAD